MAGMTKIQLSPRLVVSDADAAISFYQKAFDAELVARFVDDGGVVVNAKLRIGANIVSVKDEDDVDRSAATLGGSPVILTLDVEDAYGLAAVMVRAGAMVVFPVADMPYGLRQGRLEDPFGIQWLLSQAIEQLSDDEVQGRLTGDESS